MRRYYYLSSLLVVFVIPALISGYFVIERVSLLQLGYFVAGVLLLGGLWDVWATRHGKKDPVWLWTFNHHDTLGIKIFDLPIEEYLFYISSSIYVVFLWEIIKYMLEGNDPLLYLAFPFLATWSMLFIVVPYFLRERKDKLRR